MYRNRPCWSALLAPSSLFNVTLNSVTLPSRLPSNLRSTATFSDKNKCHKHGTSSKISSRSEVQDLSRHRNTCLCWFYLVNRQSMMITQYFRAHLVQNYSTSLKSPVLKSTFIKGNKCRQIVRTKCIQITKPRPRLIQLIPFARHIIFYRGVPLVYNWVWGQINLNKLWAWRSPSTSAPSSFKLQASNVDTGLVCFNLFTTSTYPSNSFFSDFPFSQIQFFAQKWV